VGGKDKERDEKGKRRKRRRKENRNGKEHILKLVQLAKPSEPYQRALNRNPASLVQHRYFFEVFFILPLLSVLTLLFHSLFFFVSRIFHPVPPPEIIKNLSQIK
jgi:hypothetical protein